MRKVSLILFVFIAAAGNAEKVVLARGLEEKPIRGVIFQEFRVDSAAAGIDTSHVRNFRNEDVVYAVE